MEENKSSVGIAVLITVLVMLVLGLGGYIIYEKVSSNKTNDPTIDEEDKNVDQKDQTDDNDKTEDKTNEPNNSQTNTSVSLKDVVGEYTYSKKCETVSGPTNEVEYNTTKSYIILKNDNTFEIHDATYCQTSTAYKGKYTLNGNKIVLSGLKDDYSDPEHKGELNIFNLNNITSKTEITVLYSNNSLKFNNITLTK